MPQEYDDTVTFDIPKLEQVASKFNDFKTQLEGYKVELNNQINNLAANWTTEGSAEPIANLRHFAEEDGSFSDFVNFVSNKSYSIENEIIPNMKQANRIGS